MNQASTKGMFNRFEDVYILDGLRTPMVDYLGAFADANPIDLGIKAARSVLARSGVDAREVDSVITGNMAPGGFDQFYVARHIGLYAGVPQEVPALNRALRDQRSTGRADAGRGPRTGAGPGQVQRQRRCHRARPSARSHRCAADDYGRAPTEGSRRALGCCSGLCGRWPGRCAVD